MPEFQDEYVLAVGYVSYTISGHVGVWGSLDLDEEPIDIELPDEIHEEGAPRYELVLRKVEDDDGSV